MNRTLACVISVAGLLANPVPVLADDVTDTLDAARAAYEAGDITTALDELAFAQSMMQDMRIESLTGFLPEAPAGWTREVSSDVSSVLAFAGGGIGAEGAYTGDGQNFNIQIMVDSPMMTAMASLVSNPMLAKASGGELHRHGKVKILEMDQNLTTIIANRILVTASGADTEVMMPVVQSIDFEALEAFRP